MNRPRHVIHRPFADGFSEKAGRPGLIDKAALLLLVISIWWFGGASELSRLSIDLLCLAWSAVVFATTNRKDVSNRWILSSVFLAVFVVYGAVSTLNPAFLLVEQGDLWWVEGLAPVAWLPAGFAPNWGAALGWPPILHAAAVGAFGLGLALRVNSPARVRFLLMCGTWSAGLLGVVGILFSISGTRLLLGIYDVPFEYFFGPIVYKNHAVALLTLLCGFAATEWLRASQSVQDRRSGWNLAAGLAAGVTWSALILTRSAYGLFSALCLALLAGTMIWLSRGKPGVKVAVVAFALTSGAAVAIGWNALASKAAEWGQGKASNSVGLRVDAIQAGTRMWLDRPVTGWGPGSFQYGFSHYKRAVPTLDQNRHLQLHWRHLHCDPMEVLIEWGILGTLPLVVALGFLGVRLARGRVTLSDPFTLLKAALFLVVLHSFVDFPFRNVAVALHGALALVTLVHLSQRCLLNPRTPPSRDSNLGQGGQEAP